MQYSIYQNEELRIPSIKSEGPYLFVCLASIYSHRGRYKSVDIVHVLSEDQI